MTASKYITSMEGIALTNSPSISFMYKGASIAPIQITKHTATEVQVALLLMCDSRSQPAATDPFVCTPFSSLPRRTSLAIARL